MGAGGFGPEGSMGYEELGGDAMKHVRGLLGAGVCLLMGVTLMGAEGKQTFPAVEGKALTGEAFKVPASFSKTYNLALIAFLREQQRSIDTWIPELEKLERSNPDFAFYEFPVLPEMNAIARWWIYQGMRSGIRSEQARARTVTFHLDKSEFRRHLGIAGEDSIQLFLLDRAGAVLWRSSGKWSRDKEDALRQFLLRESTVKEAPRDEPPSEGIKEDR
jgi:hypothetical protein